MENTAQRNGWKNVEKHKFCFLEKGIKYKVDVKKCKYILYTMWGKIKKCREKFPDMKLFVLGFKDSYRRKACNTASFSVFLPFPAVLQK